MRVIDTNVTDDEKEVIEYDSRLVSKITWRLIPFMLILYVVSYLDRINVSFAGLQMNRDLHISDWAFGLGSGIFFIGYCLFGIPSNLIIERFGPRRWISSIMIFWGLITILMCFMKHEMDFFVLRFILGVAEAGFFPGMILYLTYWFPARYYGAAVARFMTAIPVAGVLGSSIAAFALNLTLGGLSGWMWLFIVTGLPAVVLGISVLFLMPDRPRDASWLSAEEKLSVEKMLSLPKPQKDSASAGGGEGSQGFFTTIREFYVWRFAVLYFMLTISMYGFQLWLPQIIKDFGDLNVTQIALLSALPAIFQALGMLVIAGHSDKTGERRFHVVAATACTVIGLIVCCLELAAWVKLTGLCVAAFGMWGSVGPFWALTTNGLKRQSHATGIAVINSVGNLGGFVGPTIVGLAKDHFHSFFGALIALALASVLAGVLAATSPKHPGQKVES